MWSPKIDKPKSNISDVGCIARSLTKLRTDTIIVGLNLSREDQESEPFSNFHDKSPHGQDFKLRHALEGTKLEGAYMTDVLKGIVEVDSSKAVDGLLPEVLAENMNRFRAEIKDVNDAPPNIYALGAAAYRILKENMEAGVDYNKLVKLTHYSFTGMNKETYREHVVQKII